MDTAGFLRQVLPQHGLYFSATPAAFEKNGKQVSYFKHQYFETVEELTEHCLALSQQGKNAYFACCSHKAPFYEVEVNGATQRKYRGGSNAYMSRAQWVDIDCGNKEYPTQKDGVKALVQFCKASSLPPPNLVVNSGNGVHVYWTFVDDVRADAWLLAAKKFKAILARFNFAQTDTTRTADVASVLRPIGTNNDKSDKGKGVKPVVLVGQAKPSTMTFESWNRKLVDICDHHGIVVPASHEASKNDALSGGIEYPPADANKIANRCQQIRLFRDDLGANQDEPTWRACLGVVGYCENGEEVAHVWSSGYEGYDEEVTQEKLHNWMDHAGPTTCAHFRGCNPEGCKGCKHEVTSPIVLGRPDPQQQTEVVVEVESKDEATGETVVEQVKHEIPAFPEQVSKHYRWDGSVLFAQKKGEDGEHEWVPFCHQLPVLDYSYWSHDEETYVWKVKAMVRPGVWREGDVKCADIARGGIGLLGALGGSVGVIPRGSGLDMVNYMRTWAEALTHEKEEVAVNNRFGWHDDGSFLIGTKKYCPNGEIKEVLVSQSLKVYAEGYRITGSLERYVELIDKVYNRPNHQMYQFTWLAGFASILLRPVHGAPVGIPLTSWSAETGQGKTTAALAAVSIWGNPYAANQIASANKITEYALSLMAGARRDLPVVMDEVTMWEPRRVAQFAYDYSDGRPKIQGKAAGGLRDNSHLEWYSFMLLTTNRSVVQDMVATIPDCAAQVARVIEYRYDTLPHETLSRAEGVALFDELWKHSGTAGDAFLKYVVPRREEVRLRCVKARDEFSSMAGVDKDARFWLLGVACIWVAYEIARELGLCRFDETALKNWIVLQIKQLKGTAGEANRDALELFGDLMSEMQRGMLVTDTEGDRRAGKPAAFLPGFGIPTGPITGRAIQDKKLVYLSHTAMREWCVKRGISPKEMETQLAIKGWLKTVNKFTLGKGLLLSLPQVRCLVLDWEAFESHLTGVPSTPKLEEAVNA